MCYENASEENGNRVRELLLRVVRKVRGESRAFIYVLLGES